MTFLWLRSDERRIRFCTALFIIAPLWQHFCYRMAGGAMYVNSWRFDLRYSALMAGCCLALLRHRVPRLTAVLGRNIAVPALALATIVASLTLPLYGLGPSISFLGVALFMNFAVENKEGVLATVLNWAPIVWVGRISFSLYLWQQLFCFHSALPWVGQFPQNVVAAGVMSAFSYYVIEMPFQHLRKRVPHWPRAPKPKGLREVPLFS